MHLSAVIQDSCARVLLFRGANKEIKNYNSQTAFQVRVLPKSRFMLLCTLSCFTSLTCQSWVDWMTCFRQPDAATWNMLIAIKTLNPPYPLAAMCLTDWWSLCETDTVTDFWCRSKLICLYTRQAGPHSAQNISTHIDFTHLPQQRTKCLNIY